MHTIGRIYCNNKSTKLLPTIILHVYYWDSNQIKPPNRMKLLFLPWMYRKAWWKISLIKISSDKGNRSHFSAKIWSIKLSIKWEETSIHYVICSLFDRVNKMYRSSAMASLSPFEITYIIHMTSNKKYVQMQCISNPFKHGLRRISRL